MSEWRLKNGRLTKKNPWAFKENNTFGVDVNLTHGHAKRGRRSHTYSIWCGMKKRCNNSKEPGFKNYGGRGITYDPRWEKFENFLADMGEKPEGMSLDRIDNDGNYGPDNCRWVTRLQQSRNSRRVVSIEVNGVEMGLGQACKVIGIKRATVSQRRGRGWSLIEALSTPVGGRWGNLPVPLRFQGTP